MREDCSRSARYNTDIEVIGVNSGLVKHSISAGDDAYQVVTGGTSTFASGYVLTSMVQNLYKFDEIDLSKPWGIRIPSGS